MNRSGKAIASLRALRCPHEGAQLAAEGRGSARAYAGPERPGLVSDAGDVGGEEVHAVAVEVPAGAVVVLGGAGVGVAGQDLGVA